MTDNHYALFKDGKQISKKHASRQVALIEAYERGAIVHYSADFIGDASGTEMIGGYEIREVQNDR